jgi:L-serine dehydratase
MSIPFTADNIHFEEAHYDAPHDNTLVFRLSDGGKIIAEEEYYSIGGGFIRRKGERVSEPPAVPYPYNNMSEFRKIARKKNLSLSEIIIRNEEAVSGKNRDEIIAGIRMLIRTMCESVEAGLKADGLLPGPIGLLRKAGILYANAQKCRSKSEKALAELNAYAMAAAEENAAGKRVVTAPTSGSSGVLPGIIYSLKKYSGLSDEKIAEGMLAAALIAFIAKHNASIAGAEVGCQGEVGVASSMGAALIAYVKGCELKRIENAAEIALEHHLGLTCDPVEGYVQVPCIERNAVGAATAYNAYILASIGDPVRQKITLDEVIEAMLETGKDMSGKYRETARGGLAVCCTCC